MAKFEDEFGVRPASDAEYQMWDRDNIRGIRSQFAGDMVDERGNRRRVYNVIDAEFDARPAESNEEKEFRYMNWHQTQHRHVRDPRCKICAAEQQFRAEHPDLIGKRVGVTS